MKCIHKSYIDIFTNTVYEIPFYVDSKGHPAVTKAEPIITNTEYLTEEEALRILKELNPTYLKEVEKKILRDYVYLSNLSVSVVEW